MRILLTTLSILITSISSQVFGEEVWICDGFQPMREDSKSGESFF